MSEVLELTQELVRTETINPPGRESRAAMILAARLEAAGFEVERHPLADGRDNVVARLPGSGGGRALCMTGHLDTVPLGHEEWEHDALSADVDGDRLHGRGSSDMKGGVAAIVIAAERVAALGRGEAGLELVLCAAEETGCEGARALVDAGVLGEAGAVLVAEPTSNYPCVAHKGVVWLEASTTGRAAHGSMPHLGENAIFKLAPALAALESFDFGGPEHELLGKPTLSVGTVAGGMNINSVPDWATAGIDVRTVPGLEGDGGRGAPWRAPRRRRAARPASRPAARVDRSQRSVGRRGLRGHGAADRRAAGAARPRVLHGRRGAHPRLRDAADDHLRPRRRRPGAPDERILRRRSPGGGGRGLLRDRAAMVPAVRDRSEAVVRGCLERIAERDPQVHAWAWLDPEAALAQARAADADPEPRSPLHGVPVGIKDIIETADMPTEYGSPIYAGSRPAADAACVARLRAAGAVILGKTKTTEFAYFHPADTANPHDLERTPGGSSSGSAAAVADGMVPVALGTQTAGSVIRPASFCGVLGLKPTHGLLDLDGVRPLSARLDTLGLFAREVDDLESLLAVLGGIEPLQPPSEAPRIAFARTERWELVDPDARAALEEAARQAGRRGAGAAGRGRGSSGRPGADHGRGRRRQRRGRVRAPP